MRRLELDSEVATGLLLLAREEGLEPSAMVARMVAGYRLRNWTCEEQAEGDENGTEEATLQAVG